MDGPIEFGRVMERMRSVRAAIEPHDSPERFRGLGVDVVLEDATIPDHHVVRSATRTVHARRILIATGSRAAVPRPCPRHPLSRILFTMRVRVLFFASYRDLAGTGELEIQLPRGATAERLILSLRRGGDAFAGLPDKPVVAINREYASLGTALEDGDEVAILPPVAGG